MSGAFSGSPRCHAGKARDHRGIRRRLTSRPDLQCRTPENWSTDNRTRARQPRTPSAEPPDLRKPVRARGHDRSSLGHRPHTHPARRPVPPPGAPVRQGPREEGRDRGRPYPDLHTWAVMARGQDYADAGEGYFDQRDQRNREHLIRHHQQPWPGSAARSPWSRPGMTARHRAWPGRPSYRPGPAGRMMTSGDEQCEY